MRKRSIERLLLDERTGVTVLVALVASATAADHAALPRLAVVAWAFVPAALAHVAATLPRPATLVRFAPHTIAVPYLACAVLAAFGVSVVPEQAEAQKALVVLIGSLSTLLGLLLLFRAHRYATRPDDERGRRTVRWALASGTALGVAWAVWSWWGSGGSRGSIAAALLALAFLVATFAWRPRSAALDRSGDPGEGGGAGAVSEHVSLEQVARGIAHAMLKPTSAVAQQLRLISRHVEDPTVRTELEHAGALMAQLEKLVRDVLDLARAQAEPARRRVSLVKIVRQAVTEVQQRFRDAEIEVDSGEGWLLADELAIRRLLTNLLENALDAAPPPGWVAVRTEHSGAWVQIMVEDRSGGIAPELQARLFEPFVTTKMRGSGLGLAIAREICRAHGGRIAAHPIEGGTRFLVTMPAQPPGDVAG